MKDHLNFKQRRFVEAYAGEASGNATEAARIAGYRSPNTQGPRLLSNIAVQEALTVISESDSLVATREERQRFWTHVMNSSEYDIRDRLRASEILGKSQGDFIDRVEAETAHTVIVEYIDGMVGYSEN